MKSILARLTALVLVLGVAFVWSAPAFSQEPPKKPEIKRTVAPNTPVDSGAAMYNAYCAACHGVRGEGNGPAAPALKAPPPNLRTLAQRNKGTFPSAQVQSVLKFGIAYPAHGSSDMPVWGPTLRALSGDGDIVTLRIANINEHLKTLQVP
jgi:mono/diheme cytochrome c family protein